MVRDARAGSESRAAGAWQGCNRASPRRRRGAAPGGPLLTGQYQHRVGMYRNGLDINRDGATIAELLAEHGYETAMTGK